MSGIMVESLTWKEYLEKGNTREAEILEKLIKEDKVIIYGYTLAEILKDIKDRKTFKKLVKGFLALPYVEIEKEDWIKASKLIFTNKKLTLEKALVKVLAQRWNLKVLGVAEND